jgi:apolipoprotein N-acyltransferase
MTVSQKPNPLFIISGILFSGLCWYLSYSLSGDYWYLLWVAPIPILMLSFRLSAKPTFITAFIAYLLGRLSWFSYLVSVATIIPAIIFTILIPFIFAIIILQTRRIVTRSVYWWTAFVFPVLYTSFEFLVYRFSQDGSAASIAYTQSNQLPLIQIASVTGITGISFMVTFFPSAIAVGWHHRREKKNCFI